MKTEHAILGLIKMHPDVTGYQLKSIMDQSSGHIARIHLSKIYPALKAMTERGLLTCRELPQEGRLPQKFYSPPRKARRRSTTGCSRRSSSSQRAAPSTNSCCSSRAWATSTTSRSSTTWTRASFIWKGSSRASGWRSRTEIEEDYVSGLSEREREGYIKLWRANREFMARETAARLDYLRNLRKRYGAQSLQ